MGWASIENKYHDDKVFDACGLFGFIDTTGQNHGAEHVITALLNMKVRGNGLGAGYAVYGLYPELADYYAFHVMCRDEASRQEVDEYLRHNFTIVHDEPIPHKQVHGLMEPPLVWRYFLSPRRIV